ncbi:argininosuccinate synthase [Syntrophus aciditrophicus]|uniref:Argininosuccinate synthase n=1 Tax=Syntrophus aciditrophicus (strain SB) TaxID=56780 RepID=ASSY_SYNAS|nr:argininosuccinate synthase [Syntrophus aciditrophicus]Q2LT97.1 RecName: Full=Argininosuccinate synthase; AltName: Full=Citrulline--aspartate ligase [Syntrophus aciditrophicus SB]ABC77308.1 argininosuccinate synthase [Syntrophus aciditrophicus SB]OPY17838.1 MAG: Argininosuccinate synthase [Syntrophus sp. PtaB.Bin075]
MDTGVKKVVLAYSGGLDTSVIVQWLIETYGCEVIAFAADVGQKEELEGLREKAIKTGASKIYIEDLREEFARDFVFPALRANAIYEGTYLLGTSLARPLIAKRQVEIARAEGADAVCHGATGKGNDQVRFELTYMALEPNIRIISAWKDPNWHFKSREDMFDYAEKHNIPLPLTREKPYSSDRNLLHISHEGAILEDPWAEPPEDIFTISLSPEAAPDKPTYVEIDFEQGNPVALDGARLSPAALMEKMNDIAGANGIGRVDMVENRFVGMKSRGVYETPGGTVLWAAHRALESLTMDREVMLMRDSLIPKYAQLAYNGFWYAPEMEALQALIDETQKKATGTVRMKLYKGNSIVVGRKSPYSLYSEDFATFEKDQVYNQMDATGFIRLNALRLRIAAMKK